MQEILMAREMRWRTRQALAAQHACAILSATPRLPSRLISQPRFIAAFDSLCLALGAQLMAIGGRLILQGSDADGPFRHYALPEAEAAKRLAIAFEDNQPGGAMLDLDVMDAQGRQLSRADFGLSPRACLVCGERPAGLCVSARRHSEAETDAAFHALLERLPHTKAPAEYIADCALRALLHEAALSPKPGLVDRQSRGAHGDMDIHTFINSALSLRPYFAACAQIGGQTGEAPERLLSLLRPLGMAAERDMLRATGGVNTHRGAIFSLGILCSAVARLWPDSNATAICALAAAIAAPALLNQGSASHGDLARRLYGAPGARGEAALGFPMALAALDELRASLNAGHSLEHASMRALYLIMSRLEDSNVLYRGGLGGLRFMHREAGTLLQLGLPEAGMAAFARQMLKRGLSPGGSADCLAQALFLHLLQDNGANVTNE